MQHRRRFTVSLALLFGLFVLAGPQFAACAVAKDGGGNSGSGGGHGGDDGGGGGRGGDDHGGSGGGNDRHDDRGGGGGDHRESEGKGGGGSGWDSSGSGEARQAVQGGGALALGTVMPTVRRAVPGRVLDVDLQRRLGGGWVYKFRVLTPEGSYAEIFVDALANRILQIRGR